MGQCSSRCPPLNIFVSLCAVLIFAVLRQLKSTIMSSAWPSAYGYKYTPIGLRQRERKEDTGKRYFYTSVHLPEGGYLLDIERSYNPDGSVGKKDSYKQCSPYPSEYELTGSGLRCLH